MVPAPARPPLCRDSEYNSCRLFAQPAHLQMRRVWVTVRKIRALGLMRG